MRNQHSWQEHCVSLTIGHHISIKIDQECLKRAGSPEPMGTMCYASHWGEGKQCSKDGRLNGEVLCFESTLWTTMEKHPRASISIKLSQTSQWQYQVWALSLKSSLGVQVRGIWQRPRWKIAFLVKRLIFTRKLNHSICQLRLLCFSVFLGEVLGFGPGSAEIRSNSLWREWSEGHGVGQAQTEKH